MNIHIHGNKLLVEQVHKHQLQKTKLSNLMNIHIHGNKLLVEQVHKHQLQKNRARQFNEYSYSWQLLQEYFQH